VRMPATGGLTVGDDMRKALMGLLIIADRGGIQALNPTRIHRGALVWRCLVSGVES
jgi:hypothetical protein